MMKRIVVGIILTFAAAAAVWTTVDAKENVPEPSEGEQTCIQ